MFVKILILLKKNVFLKTQVRDTEHKTQDTNTERRTQTQVKYELLIPVRHVRHQSAFTL